MQHTGLNVYLTYCGLDIVTKKSANLMLVPDSLLSFPVGRLQRSHGLHAHAQHYPARKVHV
jgi:hypothetical protein